MVTSFSFSTFTGSLPLYLLSLFCSILCPPSSYSSVWSLVGGGSFGWGVAFKDYVIQTAPAFSKTYLALTCDWIGITLSNFQSSLLKLAIILSSKYLLTILMFFLGPSNTQLLSYASSCTDGDFMQVLWLLMVFPTSILRFLA